MQIMAGKDRFKYQEFPKRSHQMKKIILLALFFMININLYAGTRDPSTPDEKYIEYGKKYKCVVRIINTMNDNKTKSFASAVIIKPRWALTAAHVIRDTVDNTIILDSNKEILVQKTFIPEKFEKEFGSYDIAICKLSDDAEIDFYPDLYEKDDEVGKIAGIAGFGITGIFSSKERIEGISKRAGSNRIDSIDKHLLLCTASRSDKTELEFIICNGDSGGGLFIDKKLAGINSCVLASDKDPDASYGDEGGHTRISIHRDWIIKTIESN